MTTQTTGLIPGTISMPTYHALRRAEARHLLKMAQYVQEYKIRGFACKEKGKLEEVEIPMRFATHADAWKFAASWGDDAARYLDQRGEDRTIVYSFVAGASYSDREAAAQGADAANRVLRNK